MLRQLWSFAIRLSGIASTMIVVRHGQSVTVTVIMIYDSPESDHWNHDPIIITVTVSGWEAKRHLGIQQKQLIPHTLGGWLFELKYSVTVTCTSAAPGRFNWRYRYLSGFQNRLVTFCIESDCQWNKLLHLWVTDHHIIITTFVSPVHEQQRYN